MITDITPLGNFKQKGKDSVENIQKTKYLYAPDAKILVVDDNEMNLKVMKNLLKLNAIKPDMVSSGEEALEKLKVETYDIILLDHMMPKMDGIETLEKAKENYLIGADTTVIALTANAVVGARETYLKAGFDDYLSKPVEIKALEQTLAKYLRPEMVDYKTRDEITVAEEIRKATEKKKAERAIIDGKPEERRGEDRRQTDDRRQEERRKGDRRHEDNEGDDFEILEFFPEDEENEDNTDVDEKDIDVILNANGINTADGLTYCADDEEFYREILNDYANSSDDRIRELEEACAAMDLDNYTIKVHALKSVAKTVGDKNVFEMAYALEMAAKGKDSETVQKKHPDLIAEYKEKAGIIKGIFKKS
jgi:CheY-like chemotaxis protein/HPt (histidine-containing phosphotransfer) domain-containing protein